MSLIAGNIKSLLQIKFKARHDGYTDQFSRILMVKIALVSSMLLGLDWFKDTITCLVPGTAEIDKGYVAKACWIQGFYIYKDSRLKAGKFVHYGIPDLSYDGRILRGSNLDLCVVGSGNPDCKPMEKTFYLQYQWFPFYVATLGLLYYLPYILFRYVNTDLISLKRSIKSIDIDINGLVENYFNYQINPPVQMRMRLLANLFVKICYLIVNVIAFVATDALLNGDFKNYGIEWVRWSKMTNKAAYDYTATRELIKPGEMLLPTFGFCEVLQVAKDKKHTLHNIHKFVCEISTNVLYQYVLILLWFLFIIGIFISSVGFISQLIDHVVTTTCFLSQGNQAKKVYQSLTLRECEYLEFVRKTNMPAYGKLIRRLKEERIDRLSRFEDGHYRMKNPYEKSQHLLTEAIAEI